MNQALQSKTILGLLFILLFAAVLAFLGKLNAEMVEVIKWVGGSFMAVRTIANLPGNSNGNTSQKSGQDS